MESEAPARPSLPVRLRDATADAHRSVERRGFVRRMLTGRLTRAEYVALLRALHDIYEPLERGLAANADHPWIRATAVPGVERTEAIERDLDALAAPGWRSEPQAPTAGRYRARLETLGAEDPGLLVAHAYVRYLGDLSGGLMLEAPIRRALGVEDELAFFDYGTADPAELKARFRAGLEAIPPGLDAHARLAEEASEGFRLHEALFGELGDDD